VNKGLIFDIKRFTVHDGPGIRTTVFFKGCPLRCQWCHNPESQVMDTEETITTIVFDDRIFRKKEITGRWMTTAEVIQEIEKDLLFYDVSNGGVTISGGEPLMQPEFLADFLDRLKEKDIHTILDTSGYASKTKFLAVIDKPDLFYWDIKLINKADHKNYTGVSNRRILENLLLLCEMGKNPVLRFAVIPGITDTRKNIDGVKELLNKLKEHVQQIDLLPYHSLAKSKYKRLNKPNKLGQIRDLMKKDLTWIKKEFEECGVKVKLGG
jgi:pyruvate formate lyase activating enzyme